MSGCQCVVVVHPDGKCGSFPVKWHCTTCGADVCNSCKRQHHPVDHVVVAKKK